MGSPVRTIHLPKVSATFSSPTFTGVVDQVFQAVRILLTGIIPRVPIKFQPLIHFLILFRQGDHSFTSYGSIGGSGKNSFPVGPGIKKIQMVLV